MKIMVDILAPELMGAVLMKDESLRLLVPGDENGKKGQVNIYDVSKEQGAESITSKDKLMEVTDGKQNYRFCTLSEDGKFAAFAQHDGRTYRVYDLESQ